MTATIEAFRQAMHNAGIAPPDEIIADGNLHRYTLPGDKPRTNNGWYVLHLDGVPAARFGSWKDSGVAHKWSAKPYQSMTTTEKTAHAANMKAMKRQREEERAKVQAACREWCAGAWPKAKDATSDNPYLKLKGVKAYGLKAMGDALLIPVHDLDRNIFGVQFVQPDTTKRFKSGTDKHGHFYKIGTTKENTIVICEGYATGASIHMATGHAVACAFDAGNLPPVAQTIRARFPEMRIIIAADNDAATEGNPGVKYATAAAQSVGALLAIPSFAEVCNG